MAMVWQVGPLLLHPGPLPVLVLHCPEALSLWAARTEGRAGWGEGPGGMGAGRAVRAWASHQCAHCTCSSRGVRVCGAQAVKLSLSVSQAKDLPCD
jgi:hypothetical protein